ncbi:MAG: hypothetical protein QW514_06440 [Thermoprotei archaeon]
MPPAPHTVMGDHTTKRALRLCTNNGVDHDCDRLHPPPTIPRRLHPYDQPPAADSHLPPILYRYP